MKKTCVCHPSSVVSLPLRLVLNLGLGALRLPRAHDTPVSPWVAEYIGGTGYRLYGFLPSRPKDSGEKTTAAAASGVLLVGGDDDGGATNPRALPPTRRSQEAGERPPSSIWRWLLSSC